MAKSSGLRGAYVHPKKAKNSISSDKVFTEFRAGSWGSGFRAGGGSNQGPHSPHSPLAGSRGLDRRAQQGIRRVTVFLIISILLSDRYLP